jgi:carbonic anhydrase
MIKKFLTLREDLSAGLVVFLVALPLCLGVGLASTNIPGVTGMPNVFSGIIAGVIGGVFVGFFSGSRIGVSGPAAGLITIIVAAIGTLGSFQGFLLAVLLSGVIQLIASYLKLGILASYFPSAVIKGMLAAIGITLILKEIPHAFGYDADFFGDEAFRQPDGHNTFSELFYAFGALQPGAIIISLVSIALLLFFDRPFVRKMALFKFLPGALFVVVLGVIINQLFKALSPGWQLMDIHLVQLPVPKTFGQLLTVFQFPDFSFLTNPQVYVIGGTIALVGSLETLLSVEATDKLDPEKHHTPTNQELRAQGIGNIISGLIGGLPVTQVIVRSSANVNAGAKSKIATIFHGILLLVTVIFIPSILNLIPLASLAAILIMVGYKLSKVELYRNQFRLGLEQFTPFLATIIGVLVTDLLKGIGIGMCFAIFYILRRNYRNNYILSRKSDKTGIETEIILSEEVTFLNKGGILKSLEGIPKDSSVTIDGSRCRAIDHDVLEIIQDFREFGAPERNIKLTTINIPEVALVSSH